MTALTVAALLTVVGFLVCAAVGARRVRRADVVLRRDSCRLGASEAVEHAARLGLVNPAPPRRWSYDRNATPERAPRVVDLMTHR